MFSCTAATVRYLHVARTPINRIMTLLEADEVCTKAQMLEMSIEMLRRTGYAVTDKGGLVLSSNVGVAPSRGTYLQKIGVLLQTDIQRRRAAVPVVKDVGFELLKVFTTIRYYDLQNERCTVETFCDDLDYFIRVLILKEE